jgi:hypothetical protein
MCSSTTDLTRAGYSSTQITDEIYAHVSDDAVTEAMDDVFGDFS